MPDSQSQAPSTHVSDFGQRWQHRRRKRLIIGATSLTVIIAIVGGVLVWLKPFQPPANANPFTVSVRASLKFPVYYPTHLPAGYRTDTHSVTLPQDGVVVFNLVGPKGEKVYISQEARPIKFSLGNFYNTFTDLKEVGIKDGAIAVGRLNHGRTEVASRANNTTWILSNTTAHIPLDQLREMLNSLQPSH